MTVLMAYPDVQNIKNFYYKIRRHLFREITLGANAVQNLSFDTSHPHNSGREKFHGRRSQKCNLIHFAYEARNGTSEFLPFIFSTVSEYDGVRIDLSMGRNVEDPESSRN